MSYENIPKNLPENTILTRLGIPEYTKLNADPFPVPSADPKEVGARLLVTDTGIEYFWTGTQWFIAPSSIPKNWDLELAAGRIPGKSAVRIFGRNPDLSNSPAFEDLWNGGDEYTGFNATVAQQIEIFSSSSADVNTTGTGAWLIQVVGLDATYNQITEVVALNGTTPVTTVQSYLRCALAFILTAGSSGHNVGAITGRQVTTTANVFFVMPEENNRTLICAYTVPAGKVAYIQDAFVSLAKKGNASLEYKGKVRRLGSVFQTVEYIGVNSTGSSYIDRTYKIPLIPTPAGADIKICASSDTNSVGAAGGISIILEDAP